ncbi:hypothetical protein HG531_006468 [Fusarium graminearum]|nr:hypothetical protein HG531_006468 [Fusarium graminearum]
MSKNADCGDDGDDYNSSCCIGCCRAGDFGTHDGCGPCYCRRSFKQDHDRTIYTGWSLGQYYPGEKGHGGPSPITGEDKPMSFENRLGGMKQASEQQAQKSGENKETSSVLIIITVLSVSTAGRSLVIGVGTVLIVGGLAASVRVVVTRRIGLIVLERDHLEVLHSTTISVHNIKLDIPV